MLLEKIDGGVRRTGILILGHWSLVFGLFQQTNDKGQMTNRRAYDLCIHGRPIRTGAGGASH